MYVLGTKVLDRDYGKLDFKLKTMKPISEYGLPEEFYGGSVSHIVDTEFQNIALLVSNKIDGLRVIDVAVKDPNRLSLDVLKKYAELKRIKVDENEKVTKEQLIKMLDKHMLEID